MTRNATAPTATVKAVAAPAFRTASTAIAAARAASTVAITVGVLLRKWPQGRRPRPPNEASMELAARPRSSSWGLVLK